MTAVLAAYAVILTVGCFVVTAMAVGSEIRDHLGRRTAPEPAPAPRIPEQRRPTSAAAVVQVGDPRAYEDFLAELIVTPHVEEALSW